jgi:hypothetical protein
VNQEICQRSRSSCRRRYPGRTAHQSCALESRRTAAGWADRARCHPGGPGRGSGCWWRRRP